MLPFWPHEPPEVWKTLTDPAPLLYSSPPTTTLVPSPVISKEVPKYSLALPFVNAAELTHWLEFEAYWKISTLPAFAAGTSAPGELTAKIFPALFKATE